MTTDEQVLAVLAEITEDDAVARRPDLSLYDTHLLDSLRTVELILAFEERFGLEIAPAELDRTQWATPRLIVADIAQRLRR